MTQEVYSRVIGGQMAQNRIKLDEYKYMND
jgi:hypothetical protein